MRSVMRNLGLSTLAVAVLVGCAATSTETAAPASSPQAFQVPLAQRPQVSQPLTLNQIMANPDWMGVFAKEAYWSDDSQSVLFARQASAAPVRTYYQQGINDSRAVELALDKLHAADQQFGVLDSTKSHKAYLYQGNIFVKQLSTGKISQLTRQRSAIDGVRYLNNGDIAYWQGDNIFQIHQNSGLVEQLAEIKMAKAPEAVKEPTSYIAKQQHRLIKYVALQQENAKAKAQYQDELQKSDPTIAAKTWYLGDSEQVSELS
ncbi:MAG: S9 family peptidase, partial [Shewanella sp.]